MAKCLAVVTDEKELLAAKQYAARNLGKKDELLVLCVWFWPEDKTRLENVVVKNAAELLTKKDFEEIDQKAGFFAMNWYRFDRRFAEQVTFKGINLGVVNESDFYQFFERLFLPLMAVLKALERARYRSIVVNRNSLAGMAAVAVAEAKSLENMVSLQSPAEKVYARLPNLNRKKLKEVKQKLPELCKRLFEKTHEKGKKTVFIRGRGYLGELKEQLQKDSSLHVVSLDEFLLKKLLNPLTVCRYLSTRLAMRKRLQHIFDNYMSSPALTEKFVFDGINFSKALKPQIDTVVARHWPEFVFLIGMLSELFESAKPDALVVWEDTVAFERICTLLAKQTHTSSLVMQHGQFISMSEGNWIRGYAPLTADKMAVWGEMFKEILAEHGVPANRLVVTGVPRLDVLRKKEFDAKAFKRKVGIGAEKKIVGLACSSAFDRNEFKTLVEELPGILERFPLTRLAVLGQGKLAVPGAVSLQDVDLYELLNACDVLITHSPTIVLEATIRGKPVIAFGKAVAGRAYAISSVLRARNAKELEETLGKALNERKGKALEKSIQKFVYAAVFKQDGKALKRIAALVKSMAGRKFFLGIIPARSGSKRLKEKNVRELCGKPLVAHTIEGALKAKALDAAVVSTDSRRIAGICRRFGASIPFMRPKQLAGDNSSTFDAARHAVRRFESLSGKRVDCVVLLQPTSPLRKAEHVDKAIDLFLASGANSLFSVTKPSKDSKHLVYLEKGKMHFAKGKSKKGRQLFALNGAVFIHDRNTLFSGGAYPIGKKTVLFKMPLRYSVDIDTAEELAKAETILGEEDKC